MSHFDDVLKNADPFIFSVFGDACTYNASGIAYETSVVIDKNVEIVSAYDTQMAARRNVANLIKAEIPEPKRGHTITVGSDVFVVDRLDTDDGHVLRVLLQ